MLIADSTGRTWPQRGTWIQEMKLVGPDDVVTISDASGSSASIMPGFGFNCFSFKVQTAAGLIETLYAQPGFNSRSSPLASGIPVLFPFGGRLVGDTFTWEGKTYTVTDTPTLNGNSLHGFVIVQPWRIVEQTASRVVGEFQASVDDPGLLEQWPSDFLIRMSYEITANALVSKITLHNPSPDRMPYGFTTHGYYAVPLGGSRADACRITVPANKTWELDADVLPTGATIPVDNQNDLRSGPAYGDIELDAIYTDVIPEADGTLVMSIRDPESNLTLRIISTGPFREFVVYTPPHRQAIALEPYTCCPTTFDLEERGFDAGLRVLEPRQSEELRIEIRLDVN